MKRNNMKKERAVVNVQDCVLADGGEQRSTDRQGRRSRQGQEEAHGKEAACAPAVVYVQRMKNNCASSVASATRADVSFFPLSHDSL